MHKFNTHNDPGGKFRLTKWFLDFVGDQGESMIFYAAKLNWYGWAIAYTSWLNYNRVSGVQLKSRFHHVQIPQIRNHAITWQDDRFGVSGTWEPLAEKIEARIFDSREGILDWTCFQPASKVQLTINGKTLNGRGYVEQLHLTVPPWRIPMDELRWGRFGSDENNLVWIELREKECRKWLWLNGEKIENCSIEDDRISMPGHNLVLNLDRGVVLESEKKIFNLVHKMVRYMPGAGKFIPLNFLMADEYKWLSRGDVHRNDCLCANGMAIHERVTFTG
jgi:hypothetical protein